MGLSSEGGGLKGPGGPSKKGGGGGGGRKNGGPMTGRPCGGELRK